MELLKIVHGKYKALVTDRIVNDRQVAPVWTLVGQCIDVAVNAQDERTLTAALLGTLYALDCYERGIIELDDLITHALASKAPESEDANG